MICILWPVRTISFNHTGEYIASASEDLFIDISNVQSGRSVHQIPCKAAMNSVEWNPKYNLLAYAGDDKNKHQADEGDGIRASVYLQGKKKKKYHWTNKMAAMSTIQSSMAGLSLYSSSSFLGQPFLPPLSSPSVSFVEKPCQITMRLKRWERKECKENSLPVLHKMHVKLGDTVKVIAGREKGKIGEIVRLFKHNSSVIVKDLNLKTKHMKSKEQGEPGQIVKIEAAIHSSNVMLYSKEKEVASRVGHKILEDGSRVRYLIKTGEIIDSADNWKQVHKEKQKEKEEATV